MRKYDPPVFRATCTSDRVALRLVQPRDVLFDYLTPPFVEFVVFVEIFYCARLLVLAHNI